ncbi:Predicted lipoprotein with conserved Yx(FWY)xxD motif [Actinopolymorpha cephalotaxi]|uniref:Lipoprotein with Yx(FWY)xxD motif n=1 Tax=Actinopolymorpha cephalotaxi TaxID=504797 RepID=A0A1I3BXL4_9ACTN|nr:hypothetical protein [Actinopolymorpha cephalotaxi]NYH86339.1 putative lipoprotein with Yx(FWY)xxD motif [Actinopolymorpha cephalotaxi]SFH66953.1 Predicted lipoprotein with conserved Yx(FWY)xxD motif [Actinopolymorpha cephalotaxi]
MVTNRARYRNGRGPHARAGVVRLAVAATVVGALLVTGCGGNPKPSQSGDPAGFVPSAPPAYTPTAGPSVLRSREIAGFSRLLTDHRGLTVYTNSGPVNSKVGVCTGSCTSVWHPVVVRTGDVADPGTLGVRIGVADRAGGLHQITVNGHRAFTFVDDKPGQARGDRFITGGPKGQTYTWRAVVVPKDAPTQVVLKPR